MDKIKLKENVIIVDADYADGIACDFASHFSHRIGRQLPPADMAEWLVCCALDGGLEEGKDVQVILVRTAGKHGMQGFVPGKFDTELDGKAFRDGRMGEFLISVVKDENVNMGEPLTVQCIQAVASDGGVKTLAVVASDETCCRAMDTDTKASAHVVQLSMERATQTDKVEYVSMGYGLMHSMGINADELR